MSLKHKQNPDDYKGSSNHLQKKYDIRKIVDTRIHIFMALLLLASSVLIYRLYMIQIVDAHHYEELLIQSHLPTVRNTTIRGELRDRNGETLVSNRAVNSITYLQNADTKDVDRWQSALQFVKDFNVEDDLNEHDQRVLWLFLHPETELLTAEELADDDLTTKQADSMRTARVTQEMMASLTPDERKAFKVKVVMDSSGSEPGVVLKDVSIQEVANLAENSNLYPGFSFRTDSTREYTNRAHIRGIIGSLGEIPYSKLNDFLARGYSRNDIVGVSGLEYQYEDMLSGIKSTYITTKFGSLEQSNPGYKGHDLKTSIDLKLQETVEKMTRDKLEWSKGVGYHNTLNEIQMVISNPQNGDILAMVTLRREKDGSYTYDPQAVILQGYPVGSTIKGATVYMGLDQGVMKPGETVVDTPMNILGTPPRHSWRDLGVVDDIGSLRLSSNIYMFHVAIRLGGTSYIPGGGLVFPQPEETYDLMRSYYSQFGLGVDTNIDFPRSESPYRGSTERSGSILELAIGQFDNYNALQLNQYISTIANNGERVRPRLVIEAVDHDTKKAVFQQDVSILNTLDNKAALARVREGMHQCVTSYNCGALADANFSAAAKTGTAQTYNAELKKNVVNSTFVAFAPFEQPHVAVSCIAPSAYEDGLTVPNVCRDLTADVLNYYMNSR